MPERSDIILVLLFPIYSRLDFLTSDQATSLSLRKHLIVIAAYRLDDLKNSEMKRFVSVLLCWSSWELAMKKGHVVAIRKFLSILDKLNVANG